MADEMERAEKLMLAFLVVWAVAALFFYDALRLNDSRMLESIASDRIENAKGAFNALKERDTALLSSTLEALANDPVLKQVYLGNDRDKLYGYGSPLFQNLRGRYGITHFYFILPNGTVFLRLHNKEIYGDVVARSTFKGAKEASELSTGIELGKTAFALRAVMPYYSNNSLIGYVELGEEIDHFLRILKGKSSNEYLLIAEKQYLDKESWDSAMKVAGLRNSWNDMETHVAISRTADTDVAGECFTEENMKLIESGKAYLKAVKGKDAGSRFACGGFIISGAGGRPAGVVLSLVDITEDEIRLQRITYSALGKFAIACAALFALLFIIFYRAIKQNKMPEPKAADGARAAPAGVPKEKAENAGALKYDLAAINRALPAVAAIIALAAALIAGYYLYLGTAGVQNNIPGESASTNGITDSEIVIGSSSALSGHARLLGTRYLKGSMAYINKINDEGGIYGRKIRLISYDDQYDPPKTVTNTQKLIVNDKAFLLFDYVGTPTSVKVIDMVGEAKIPLFGLFTGAEEFRAPFRQYIFNVRASYYGETGAVVDYFVEKKGFTKIAVFYQDDAFGQTGLKGTEIALKRHGLSPAATATYTRGSVAVEAGAEAIRAANPDAIIMIGTYTPLAKFVNLYRKEGYDPYFHTVSFVGAEAFAAELSGYGINSSEKIIVTQVVPDPHEASAEYLALTAKYFPQEQVTYTGLEGYANAVLLVKILKDAGRDLSREKFIRAAESLAGYSVIGISATFSPGDHQAFDKIYFSRLEQKNFELFEPK